MRPDDLTPYRLHHDDIETRLRAALDERAQTVAPEYRLTSILDRAQSAPVQGRSPASRWTLGLLAAACVIALALIVPALMWGPDASPTLPATSATTGEPDPTATATTPPTTAPTTPAPSGSPSTAAGPAVDTALAALPVYFPAHIGDDLRMIRLYREWVNVEGVERSAPVDARLAAALDVAMHGSPPGTDGYLSFWGGNDVDAVEVSADRIRIVLDAPGGPAADAEEARIAVQQLVWTAQAVVGQGAIPVRFEIADGSTQLLGHLPVGQDYNRPSSTDLYYEDLAPIWVNSPTRGEAVDGPDVTITGEATVFEATYQWELIDANTGTVLRSGHGQASAGGPARGTFEIPLTGLDDGSYQIRVFALSMEDGESISAERTIPFVVGAPPGGSATS